MITKAAIIGFFTKSKIIFASIVAVVTFSITLYNQFKSVPKTEISGFVSADRNSVVPVDAVVKIISPSKVKQKQIPKDGLNSNCPIFKVIPFC